MVTSKRTHITVLEKFPCWAQLSCGGNTPTTAMREGEEGGYGAPTLWVAPAVPPNQTTDVGNSPFSPPLCAHF